MARKEQGQRTTGPEDDRDSREGYVWKGEERSDRRRKGWERAKM